MSTRVERARRTRREGADSWKFSEAPTAIGDGKKDICRSFPYGATYILRLLLIELKSRSQVWSIAYSLAGAPAEIRAAPIALGSIRAPSTHPPRAHHVAEDFDFQIPACARHVS